MSSGFNFNNNNNTGLTYYESIKFTDEEIKYIANFLVKNIEDKFNRDSIPQTTNNMHYKDISSKRCKSLVMNK
jgi:hypothetical protein